MRLATSTLMRIAIRIPCAYVSNTPLNTGIDENNNLCLSLGALTPLLVPLSSLLLTDRPIEDIKRAFFKVPARQRKQKPLRFGKCKIDNC